MTRFAITFLALATLNVGCASQTATQKRAADYAQLISEEVPDGATFKRSTPTEPTMVVKTTRKVNKRTPKVVAKATPRSKIWIAGQGSTDPDDAPIRTKPGQIVEINFDE